MYSNTFFPTINTPTRISITSRILIDNMFYNAITKTITSRNITTSFSDYLTQYLIVTNNHRDVPSRTKRECYFYKHFHNKNLNDEINSIDWENFLQILKQNLNLSFELFNQKIESLLKTYYPKTIVSNTKLKETTKPWMAKALLKSIKVKNRIYKQFSKATNPHEKTEIQKRFKVYRNHVVTLTRICKGNYCKEYFEDNGKNANNLWSGIRSIINIKNKKLRNISLTIDSKTVTNSNTLANHFNKFFTSIADKFFS